MMAPREGSQDLYTIAWMEFSQLTDRAAQVKVIFTVMK